MRAAEMDGWQQVKRNKTDVLKINITVSKPKGSFVWVAYDHENGIAISSVSYKKLITSVVSRLLAMGPDGTDPECMSTE